MALIDGARGLAPEFSADLLLRLADAPAIDDVRWKLRLIDESFLTAAHAQLPYPKYGDPTTDSRYSRLYWRNFLEALSLQTQAVEAMLPLNSQHAREMFDEIPPPDVPALTCQETGAPDPRAYYETAKDIFGRGFTPQHRKKSRDIEFLEPIIADMRSPSHVSAANEMLMKVSVTPEQRRDLYERFAGTLDHINGTPRLFQAASGGFGFRDPPPDAFLSSLRTYVVRHLSGPHCSDNRIRGGNLPFVAGAINHLMAVRDPKAERLKPITEDEVKSSKDDGTFERHIWWQSKRSKQVLDALKWLNHGNRDLPDSKRFFTLEERLSPDWNAHFLDTLKLIEGWAPEEEDSPADWFGMVFEAYRVLTEKAPRDQERTGAMSRYLNLMETHYADVESHNLWFTQLKGYWRSSDTWITERFAESKNSVIAVYTKVARLNR